MLIQVEDLSDWKSIAQRKAAQDARFIKEQLEIKGELTKNLEVEQQQRKSLQSQVETMEKKMGQVIMERTADLSQQIDRLNVEKSTLNASIDLLDREKRQLVDSLQAVEKEKQQYNTE